MPWPFFIPEFLKRRACRYLLHYYLGQFVEEKISLNDLTIDLYNGTGSVSNVPLNVETINEVLEESSAPVQVVSGYIGCVSITIPWSSLMSSSCKVEISGLCITVAPSYNQYNSQVSMNDSLFFSMSKSRQLAEEVLKTPPTTGEETTNGEEEMNGFEGMEVLAKAIETILLRVKVSLVDTVVNICQDGGDTNNNELGVHVNRIEFFDEVTQTDTSDHHSNEDDSDIQLPNVGDFATKILRLSGITIELRDTTNTHNTTNTDGDNPYNYGIPIACVNGEADVKVKIKQSDSVPGPKLDVQVLLDSIHMLLYPQQLHSLIELVNGITKKFSRSKPSDHTHQSQSHSHTPGLSRPIPEHDMRTIETQLINHIDVQRKKKMAEEEQLQLDPWDITARRTESTFNNQSEMFYSFDLQNQEPPDHHTSTSVAISNGERLAHPPTSRLCPTHNEGVTNTDQSIHPSPSSKVHSVTDEVCIYSITCGGLTCAILENTPVHTHITRSTSGKVSLSDSETDSYSSAKADTDSGSLGSIPELCSLDEGGLDPFKYFDCVKDILKGRVGRREIKNCEKMLGQILPADHIFLWMSTINNQVSVEGLSTEVALTISSAELVEYLFHNDASLPLITPVSIQSLIQFGEDTSCPDPFISLQVTHCLVSLDNPSFPKSNYSSSVPVTDIDISLTHINIYLDVTIIDRLYALLHPTHTTNPHTSHISLPPSTYGTALYYPAVNIGVHGNQKKFGASQVLFSEAISANDSSTNIQKVCIKVKTKSLNTSLRFPVADLSQSVRPPWYRPPLRKEILFFEFIDLSLSSNILTPFISTRVLSGTTSFRTANAFYSEDGIYDNRQLFIIIDSNNNNSMDYSKLQSVDMPNIKLTYQVLEDSPLESIDHNTTDSIYSNGEEGIGITHTEPSPFSQRKENVLFGSDKANNDTTSSQHIYPASSDEMSLYESHLSLSSHFCLSISIPSVIIHIPSKRFLESFYNRISMDLLLWQPASPAAVEKASARSVFYSSADILQPAMTRDDKFKMCKSVLREDSEDDNDFSFSSLISPAHSDLPKPPTLLMTSLTIDEGTVSLVLPIKTEGVPSTTLGPRLSPGPHLLDLSPRGSQCFSNMSSLDSSENGFLFVKMNGCHGCNSINYEGEKDRTQLCLKVDTMTVKHCGCVPQPIPLLMDPKTLLLDTHCINTLLKNVIIPLEDNNEGNDPMLSVSIDSRTENEANRRVHKVAVQLANTIFNYTPSSSHNSFFTQCGNVFELTDIIVPGYEPPTVITELYINLKQSGLEYRPLHLPSHGVLTFDSLNISTTLVTDSPLLVIDIMIDQMGLFVSNKQHENINLRKDFVCVMEMNIFQLALRLCNKTDISKQLFSNIPDIDLQCSGTELHMLFCVDSCAVLRDMIIYLADNGDLKEQEINHVTSSSVSRREDDPIIKPHPPIPPADDVMVASTIGDLISEAMDDDIIDKDVIITSSRITDSTVSDKLPTSLTCSEERQTITTMIFSSDSEDDELYDIPNTDTTGTNTTGTASPTKTTATTSSATNTAVMAKHMKQKLAEEWEIDEDDYCILTSPTTAKVGPCAEPVVTCLLGEGELLEVIDNYYTIPDAQVDQLKRPKHFPDPIIIYSLRELTIVWHLYGGKDFTIPLSPPSSCSPTTMKKHKAAAAATSQDGEHVAYHNRGGVRNVWKRKGGVGRDHDVLMEIELNKLRLQYECYPEGVEQSSRIVLLIHDIEIRDRLAVSRINKFLYHYATETRPRQSRCNMFSFKVLFSNPEAETHSASKDSFQCLEASVHISMLPIRINIDQDAIFFLYDFFDELFPPEGSNNNNNNEPSYCSSSPTVDSGPAPLLSNGLIEKPSLLITQTPPTTTNSVVFIKSFVFYPDVPIRIDYEAKRFHSKNLGTFTGMLLGLSHLDNSEVTLKALTYKNGVLGWNHLFEQVTKEWMQDIQRYQFPRILQGVGPVYHVTQLVQGAMDLFWLPVQQYQEDGRIIWGIQRGANSFVTSSGVAVVELSNRMLQSVEMVAKTAFDMVSIRERKQVSNQTLDTPLTHQSADVREGIVNAYNVVSTGIGDTAWDLYDAASTEHNEYGVTGAVGGVLKNIPGTIVRPIIFMSEATRHVLGGVKNQFVPDARREASDKWKNN